MKLFSKKKDDFDYNLQRSCLTCNTSFQGKYCSRCGEKVVDQQDRSIKNFLSDLLNAFTFLDGKFPTSIKSILLQPGKLSEDVVRGVRVPYMKPVSLFFVGNFLYFLLPGSEIFTTKLGAQMNSKPFSQIVQDRVNPKLEALSMSYQEFEPIYNAESSSWAKLLIVLIVILFSFVTALVNYSRSRYYADHLTYAFEFVSYVVFYPVILFFSLTYFIYWIGQQVGINLMWLFRDELLFQLPVVILMLFYFLFRGEIRFYKTHWFKALLKSLTLFLGLVGIVLVYRFVLFFVTYWSL